MESKQEIENSPQRYQVQHVKYKSAKCKVQDKAYKIKHQAQHTKSRGFSIVQKLFLCRANLNFPGKSKKKRGSVMDFFSPFGDTKPFGGFGSHMSGAARGKYILEYC